jgi:hypothetical protein
MALVALLCLLTLLDLHATTTPPTPLMPPPLLLGPEQGAGGVRLRVGHAFGKPQADLSLGSCGAVRGVHHEAATAPSHVVGVDEPGRGMRRRGLQVCGTGAAHACEASTIASLRPASQGAAPCTISNVGEGAPTLVAAGTTPGRTQGVEPSDTQLHPATPPPTPQAAPGRSGYSTQSHPATSRHIQPQ